MGGGGSISEKAGGLNDGTRMRWIGRWTVASLGPPMCAAWGRWRAGGSAGTGGVGVGASELFLERDIEERVGTKPLIGEMRRVGALGQPQSGIRVPDVAGSGEE